jgi:hypothetical protein
MPTITRKKFPIDPNIPQVTLSETQRNNLAESACLDPSSRAGMAFLSRVEGALTWHTAMLRRVPERSLPSHTIAALKPIAELAAALARLLHPEKLPREVGAALDAVDVATGHAHRYLLDISTAAGHAIKQLTDQSGPGHQNRLIAETRERALRDLEAIYRDLAAGECDDGDLAEFLERVGKCLKS